MRPWQRLAAELAGERIDVLVNNAGILERESLDDLDFERILRQFEVNALGPLRVDPCSAHRTSGVGSKVVIITSRMGSIADNGSGGYYGYRMSKAAVNMAAVSLAHDLRERGIAVLLLHPGMVATEMTGRQGIPVQESAANLLARFESLGIEQSGSFHHAEASPCPGRPAFGCFPGPRRTPEQSRVPDDPDDILRGLHLVDELHILRAHRALLSMVSRTKATRPSQKSPPTAISGKRSSFPSASGSRSRRPRRACRSRPA